MIRYYKKRVCLSSRIEILIESSKYLNSLVSSLRSCLIFVRLRLSFRTIHRLFLQNSFLNVSLNTRYSVFSFLIYFVDIFARGNLI